MDRTNSILLTGLRAPFLPALPWIGEFPETNVRTYVRDKNGDRGIWFFTLESARALAVCGARLLYGLPYRWSQMRVDSTNEVIAYTSRRHIGRPAYSSISVRAGAPLLTQEMENFFTARFRLYAKVAGRLGFADIEHEPWPLREATIQHLEENLIESVGVPKPRGEPIVYYSPGVDVRIGRLHLL